MTRILQLLVLIFLAGPAECLAEALGADRWRLQGLNRSLSGFAPLWDDLNRRILAGHPMLDSRFVDTLLQHFGDGSEQLCHLEKDGKLTGMCILKPSRPGVWSTFLPLQAQVAPVILADSAGVAGLLPGMPGIAGQVDLLCQDPCFSPLVDCGTMPHRKVNHVLTMSISLEGDFQAYWESRSSNLRNALRRRENRLAKAGRQGRLLCLEAPADMREAVTRFGKLESAGWKGRAGAAVSIDNPQGRFYADVLEKFAGTGQAVVYEYWIDDSLAASQLAIATGAMMILLKTTYDEDLADFAPGRLLLRAVIRDAFARLPGGVIEFYTNAGPEQLAWATDQRWIEHVSIFRNRRVQRLLGAVQATRRLATRLGDRLAERMAAGGSET